MPTHLHHCIGSAVLHATLDESIATRISRLCTSALCQQNPAAWATAPVPFVMPCPVLTCFLPFTTHRGQRLHRQQRLHGHRQVQVLPIPFPLFSLVPRTSKTRADPEHYTLSAAARRTAEDSPAEAPPPLPRPAIPSRSCRPSLILVGRIFIQSTYLRMSGVPSRRPLSWLVHAAFTTREV